MSTLKERPTDSTTVELSPEAINADTFVERLRLFSDLAGGLGHELNNPIQSASNYAELISAMAPPDSELGGFAEQILRDISRLTSTIHTALDFVKEDGAGPQRVSLPALLATAITLQRAPLRRLGVELTLHEGSAQGEVRVFPNECRHALVLLLQHFATPHPSSGQRPKSIEMSTLAPVGTHAVVELRVQPGEGGPPETNLPSTCERLLRRSQILMDRLDADGCLLSFRCS